MDGIVGFAAREVTLRDGRRVWLRAGGPQDAEAYRDYLLRAVPSAEGVGLFVDEVRPVEFYREKLAKFSPERGGLGLFAEPVGGGEGRIVGDCGLSGFEIRKLAGILVLGMMCDEGWRGVGLGRAMLTAALDWARASPSVRRVELGVLASNPGAAALYRSVGFVEEGRYRERFRQADGSLVDDLAMAISVG
jgi:RimJ/RimL family protein N-acetyltransferase